MEGYNIIIVVYGSTVTLYQDLFLCTYLEKVTHGGFFLTHHTMLCLLVNMYMALLPLYIILYFLCALVYVHIIMRNVHSVNNVNC